MSLDLIENELKKHGCKDVFELVGKVEAEISKNIAILEQNGADTSELKKALKEIQKQKQDATSKQ